MTITPEAKHHWEQALSFALITLFLGIVVSIFSAMWKKRATLTRSKVFAYRFRLALGLLAATLLYESASKLLNWIPLRVPPPHIATTQEAAASAAAADQRMRLAKARTLRRGDTVRIVWDHGATGAVAASGGAAHRIFDAGAAPAALAAVRGADPGSVYDVAGGTQALFIYYDTGFPDRNVACIILGGGPHAWKSAWVPGERLRKQATPLVLAP